MTLKVGINGFGRIGRLVLRALIDRDFEKSLGIEIVAINDICSLKDALHLLCYDSVHGRLGVDVRQESVKGQDYLKIGEHNIAYVSHADPSDLPWKEMGIDLVMECSGRFASKQACLAHLKAGARRVLVSAPCKEADYTVVYGINHQGLQATHQVISNASCTTNCLAPVAYTLHKNFGIEAGYMTTVHAYTNDQKMVDSNHSDLRRARAGAANMIPTSTGAASAIGLVLPELAGKLAGSAIRVPVPNVSLVDLVCTLGANATAEDVNAKMREASEKELNGVLAYSEEPLVSSDFCHHSASSTFDATQTQRTGDKMMRVLSWYDNEWGFSNRMLDTAAILAGL